MTMRNVLLILMLLISTTGVYALDNYITVRQFRDLNATTPYINDFMLCYTHNDTITNWAPYRDGVVNITDGIEHNGVFTITCCDNCYFDAGNKLVKSSLSLHYDLGIQNITSPMSVSYYVGDILDGIRGLPAASSVSGVFDFSNYLYFLPIVFILGLGMFLYVLTDNSIAGLVIGCILGTIIGMFSLVALGVIPIWFMVLLLLLMIMGVILCGRMLL